MRLAVKADKKRVVAIICESFDSNPSVNWVVKNDKKRQKRIKVLAAYAFNVAHRRDGVYISDDNEGVAICYKYNSKKEGFADYIDQAKLAINAVGITRIFKVLKREAYVKRNRPADGNFLYFWFWGISKIGKGKTAARESKNFIFEESERLQLPIYLETSVLQNKKVYERYGFETYAIWKDSMDMWLMKRECV